MGYNGLYVWGYSGLYVVGYIFYDEHTGIIMMGVMGYLWRTWWVVYDERDGFIYDEGDGIIMRSVKL